MIEKRARLAVDFAAAEMQPHGFLRIRVLGHEQLGADAGVDTELFHPANHRARDPSRPVFLYVGRVAVEKNLPAFLALELPGAKVVVGDGPQRKDLEKRFPDAVFVGTKLGAELASYFQRADVFVFPSRTDTFGLVLVEAMACGTPVAAFPVRGPIDVVQDPAAGVLDNDLAVAARRPGVPP